MPQLIQSNPKVLGGQPVIRGTRIPVARIMALVAMNYKLAELKQEFPQLSKLTKKNLSDIFSFYQKRVSS